MDNRTLRRVTKILEDNRDGNLSEKGFRDMLAQQIAGLFGSSSGKLGATVMTPEASMYDSKKDGKSGPRPAGL